jgi:hypothetical protein
MTTPPSPERSVLRPVPDGAAPSPLTAALLGYEIKKKMKRGRKPKGRSEDDDE